MALEFPFTLTETPQWLVSNLVEVSVYKSTRVDVAWWLLERLYAPLTSL